MSAEDNLRENFSALSLPDQAADWLVELWRLAQTWDDIVDGDACSRERMDHAILASFFTLQEHPFYLAHRHAVGPLVLSMVLKWKASDTIERSGDFDNLPKAYMLRAGFYDVILQVFSVVHGPDAAMKHAHQIYALYGETLADLEEEFHA